jgi:hypothetical protein
MDSDNVPRELRGITLRVEDRSKCFLATLAFSNGDRRTISLYVSSDGSEESTQRAEEVARNVGAAAAAQGDVDVQLFIREGVLPFEAYFKARLVALKEQTALPAGLQYSALVNGKPASIYIRLFNGSEEAPVASTVFRMPGAGDPEFKKLWHGYAREVLGSENERSTLKTSPRFQKRRDDDVVTSNPTSISISRNRVGNCVLFLGWKGGSRVGLTLGTRDEAVAEGRKQFVLELIDSCIKSGEAISFAEIREYIAARTAWRGHHEPMDRSYRTRDQNLGPLVFAHPEDSWQGRSTAMKIYTAVSTKDPAGTRFTVRMVVPRGETFANFFETSMNAPKLSDREANALHDELRRYLQERFGRFFGDGGSFPLEEHLRPVETSSGPGLTREGHERLHELLGGRLSGKFIAGCLRAGLHPFDLQLPAEDVNQIGPMGYCPQPIHPDIRVVLRGVSSEGSHEAIYFELLWRRAEGQWRKAGVVSCRDELGVLVQRIDEFTRPFLLSGDDLPRHATAQNLEKIVESAQSPRQHSGRADLTRS